MPRTAVRAGHDGWRDAEVGVVRPLSADDAARIRQIFAWQTAGCFKQAAQATRTLRDRTLVPDIQAQATHDHATRASRPVHRNRLLDRTVRERLGAGRTGARSALRLVERTRFVDQRYAAALRAEIARGLFTDGDDSAALRTARGAMAESGGQVALAGYVAGLAAWREGDARQAMGFFGQAWHAELASPGMHAGAAFWAARAHRRVGDEPGAALWLRRAAQSSGSFYSVLAGEVLRHPPARMTLVADDTARPGVLGEADLDAVAATPAGRRAFALLQVGQPALADAALRQLQGVAANPALRHAAELVENAAGLDDPWPGSALPAPKLPMPNLRPDRGFIVSPALVYAVTRVESNFDDRAISDAGARGLMQIMPVTVTMVSGSKRLGRSAARVLSNPGRNLEIGQRYLRSLAAKPGIDDDLIRLLASYNAGPNALAHWTTGDHERDPLLFIETLPARETRDFVHRTLCDLWLYAARMKLPAPSLHMLAQGNWPRFETLSGGGNVAKPRIWRE